MTKKILAIAAIAFLLVGCSSSEKTAIEEIDPAVDGLEAAEALEELFEDVANENSGGVEGSCNSIASHSTCLDYRGSFWTWEQIQLGCSGPDMTASKNACPYGSIGGCNIGSGTITEMVSWFYDHGGDPIDPENEKYSVTVCNATFGAKWIETE